MTPSFPTRRSSDLRPVAGGSGTARCTDGGNFFKRNSLVSGNDQAALAARPGGIAQFRGLMQILGIDPALAASIAAAAADWIDTDDRPLPDGAEDDTYARAAIPYRTANRFVEIGRASGREQVCQDVEISGAALALK